MLLRSRFFGASVAVVAAELPSKRSDPMNSKLLCEPANVKTLIQPSKLVRTAVLVRTYNPNEGALERIKDWASELQDVADLWVSVDNTRPCNGALARIERAIQRCPPSTRLHSYNQEDLLRQYPVLFELLPMIVNPSIPGGGIYSGFRDEGHVMPARSVAWGFHVEAINLWYQTLDSKRYDFVWVFEDDVGFSGNLADLIKHYVCDYSDLISSGGSAAAGTLDVAFGCPEIRVPGDWCVPGKYCYHPDGWAWTCTHSTEFRARLEKLGGKRYFCPEHVQRFSAAFLDELHRWSCEGASAWSEMSTPTICHACKGMQCRKFDKESIGDPFCFDGNVTPLRWTEILADTLQRGRLFHALKF